MTLSSRDTPELKGEHPLYVVDKGYRSLGRDKLRRKKILGDR